MKQYPCGNKLHFGCKIHSACFGVSWAGGDGLGAEHRTLFPAEHRAPALTELV